MLPQVEFSLRSPFPEQAISDIVVRHEVLRSVSPTKMIIFEFGMQWCVIIH